MNQPSTSKENVPFVFFDLGNVLLAFEHRIAWQQMAQLCELAPESVREAVFCSPLQVRYERGEISSRDFYRLFCSQLQVQPDYRQLMQAASDIFRPVDGVIGVAEKMKSRGCQLGLLSNTCPAHWEWIQELGFNWMETCFDLFVLSFQVQCLKPELEIYAIASDRAKRQPEELLLIDDRIENVEAARTAGWDAIEFVGLGQLVEQLKVRGLLSR